MIGGTFDDILLYFIIIIHYRSTLSSLPFPPPPPPLSVEDNVGLLDDLDNLGLEFEGDNGDNSPTDPVAAPPESQYGLSNLKQYILIDI